MGYVYVYENVHPVHRPKSVESVRAKFIRLEEISFCVPSRSLWWLRVTTYL